MTPVPARLQALADAALAAVDPAAAVRRAVSHGLEIRPRDGVLYVVGAGKALRGMVRGLALALPGVELRGVGIEKSATGHGPPDEDCLTVAPGVTLLPGDHPIPGARSFTSSQRLVDEVGRWPSDAPVVGLVSGGASALLCLPAPADRSALRELTRRDLGLPIDELNRRRAKLDPIKAGGLARILGPRPFWGLVISDVPTAPDALATVGSGPTVLASNRHLHTIVASNETAISAVVEAARGAGCRVVVERIDGVARSEGRRLAGRLLDLAADQPGEQVVLVAGGESTVRVEGAGLGGRSQELALGAAQVLCASQACLLALASDGEDGPTDAAGAWVDGQTASDAGTRLSDALDDNDAYPLLAELGRLIRLGRTGTNIADIVIGLSRPDSSEL